MTPVSLKEKYSFFFLVSSHCPCPPKDPEVYSHPHSLYKLEAGTRNVPCPVPGDPAGLGRTGMVLSLWCLQGPGNPCGKLTRSRVAPASLLWMMEPHEAFPVPVCHPYLSPQMKKETLYETNLIGLPGKSQFSTFVPWAQDWKKMYVNSIQLNWALKGSYSKIFWIQIHIPLIFISPYPAFP